MAKVRLPPFATETLPDGDMLPLGPALAVIVWVITVKYAVITWFVLTLVKVKLVIGPLYVPSTVTYDTVYPGSGVIV